MSEIQISINNLSKVYDNGFKALNNVSLKVKQGEILAMLGPNGAGKTSLISIICGIVKPSSGTVTIDNFDIIKDYRETRSRIGLVPQELNLESFETVFDTVSYSRGLYGKAPKPEHIEKILKDLSLWDKKDQRLRQLSGGMKRRVLIAKALSHEPKILFLDEPTAGVDVELRKDMWNTVAKLKKQGVTIILTTHYIEEAEAIADRIAVINSGEILLVEDKAALMARMGKKKIRIDLMEPAKTVPERLAPYFLELAADGSALTYTYDVNSERTGITGLLNDLQAAGLQMRDVQTQQSSLEDIFVGLVQEDAK